MTKPHKTIIDKSQVENGQLAQLTAALRQQVLKEIRESSTEKSMNSNHGIGSPERDGRLGANLYFLASGRTAHIPSFFV